MNYSPKIKAKTIKCLEEIEIYLHTLGAGKDFLEHTKQETEKKMGKITLQ